MRPKALSSRSILLFPLLAAAAVLRLLAAQAPAHPPARPPAGQAPAPVQGTTQPAPGSQPAPRPGDTSVTSKPEVTLELQRGQRAKIKLAIPAFGSKLAGGELAGPGRELEETVRADLDLSAYFDIRGADAWKQVTLSGDVQRDLPAFRAGGSEILLLGDLHGEEDKLVFEGRLFDIGSGKVILAKRYRGPASVVRRMAHTFSDEVVHYLVGAPGIALSTLAFTSDRTGFKEIYIMDYDGHSQRRITGHRSTSMSPAWSPSGDAIAYTSFFSGSPGIYLADLTSGRKRALVTAGTLNISPTFSPDGGQIAFARSLQGNIEIFTANKEGGNLRRLTNSPAIDTNPAWSPKGSEIAFTSSRSGNPHIYLMDAEGSNQRRITFEGIYNDGAAWSPDGSQVAYTARHDRSSGFQIAVTNVVTLETRLLTSDQGENESPCFSPDGRKIVFTSRRSGTKQLYMINAADGSGLHQLTESGNNDMADWSRRVEK